MDKDEKQIIPRNVINKGDIFPIDFIVHFNVEIRQLPYIILGGCLSAVVVNKVAIGIIGKIVSPIFIIGSTCIISKIKIEGQYLEQILMDIFKLTMFRCERRNNGKKNLKS